MNASVKARATPINCWLTRAILAVALGLSVTSQCQGDIIVNWLSTPTVLWSDSGTTDESIDLNGDSIIDFVFQIATGAMNVYSATENHCVIYPFGPPDVGGPVEPLSEGFVIDSGSGDGPLDWFGNDQSTPLGAWLWQEGGSYISAGRFPGNRAYMGVAFDIAGARHYGWVDVSISDSSPYGEVYGWAYETTPGGTITAGAVPEPSTIILLVAGSGAILLSRLKMKKGIR
jgi:hypothetical protein